MTELPIIVATAFGLGVGARLVGLPPLVGFLGAGFALRSAGFESSPLLERVADLGVTLLLFTIGLKLDVRSLLKPAVWAGTTIHMALFVLLFAGLFYVLDFGVFAGVDLRTGALIAFALSFSSTVFAVKTFDERGQSGSLAANTAIGMLIMQDVIAVVFLAASKGKPPSIWAIALLLLIPARVVLKRLMFRSGHGELLLLFGFIMALGGSRLFEEVGLKGDLGALAFGMLIANDPKAKELARALMGFKDLMLVGFFVAIGLRGTPSLPDVGVALLLVLFIPVKVALYFSVLTRFRYRARTSAIASLSLADYSEFGLIVGTVGVKLGWLSDQWLVIIAVAVAITFVTASPVNAHANELYDRYRNFLKRFQTKTRLPEEQPVHPGDAELLIVGMGNVGTAAYDALKDDFQGRLVGLDNDLRTVEQHAEAGRRVLCGDPTDIDFWDRVVRQNTVKIVMLALPNHAANLATAAEIRQFEDRARKVLITASARHADDREELQEHGVDAAFDLHTEAGRGYADFVRDLVQ
jgi:predicted Kef-type K+ transport protein